ncbi:cation:proton antiporter [Candidatus Parcubacteria bacterium]|nr:cation:proton antiporter [Candidatus Parcubacteria bacterium]
MFKWKWLSLAVLGTLAAHSVLASGGASANEGHGAGITLLWIAVILIAAKIASLVERVGQPAVLGELVMGVILGNLVLLGVNLFEPIKQNEIIAFLSELGVVILLFQIGLESNIQQMRKVGLSAFLVAVVGVVAPFVLGTYLVGPWLMPGLSSAAYLFLGASLTATSVGITARVFKDLGKLKTPEAQIVLGAAVFDDVLGLIILAVVTAIATVGAVSVGAISWIIAKAFLFLIGAILVGTISAPWLGRAFSRIQTGVGMKFTLALAFCLVFAYVSGLIGLAPIVGAFAAGLVLDPVHFRYFKAPKMVEEIMETAEGQSEEVKKKLHTMVEHHAERHIEELIEPVAYLLVPIFFILTGMNVALETLFNPKIIGIALAITLVAVIGKVITGLVAGPVKKAIVGVGMIPRGEVGLIFASIGKGLGVLSDDLFSVIVVMVILTTLLAPPVLARQLKK